MTSHRALLVGVPRCDDNTLTPVPERVIVADISRMRDVLLDSGYDVSVLGTQPNPAEPDPGQDSQATVNRIRAAIARTCREAPDGGVVLVYFSGHGVNIGGRDYLVPRDAQPSLDGSDILDPDSLVPLDPAKYLGGSRARLILFITDACRNEPGRGFGTELARAAQVASPPNGAFALITGCQPGQLCGYGDQGSLFTQILVDILDRRHPAQTLDRVFTEVQARMQRRSRSGQAAEQIPQLVHAYADDYRQVYATEHICNGEQIFDAWHGKMKSTELWSLCRHEGPARIEKTQQELTKLVEGYAQRWLNAQQSLGNHAKLTDAWADQDYPVRVVDRLAQLLAHNGATPALSAAEVGLLVAAPFAREAILSAGIAEAAMVEPTNFSRTYQLGARSDLEITHSMHEHICYRAEGLLRRERTEPANTLGMWLVHRWVTGRSDLWENNNAQHVLGELARVLLSREDLAKELAGRLAVILPYLGTELEGGPAGDAVLESPVAGVRTGLLACLLSLAGVLAADIRRMPSVVADHIGIRDELHPQELRTAANNLTWERGDTSLDLHYVCSHPAIHAALASLAAFAERVRLRLEEVRDRLGKDGPTLKCLPGRITDSGVKPAGVGNNKPSYTLPLRRFRLSDEKIRELLMGRQLYGDPALAVRELYQNALDACRYRHRRIRYQQECGVRVPDWTGKIILTQDVDEDGRPYLDCVDNGVGMTEQILKKTFAQAGERFVHTETFRREQGRWRTKGLRLIPNSQFGIGVFSYFMLADEISIWTRPTTDVGVADSSRAYRIDIGNGGSLLRIREDREMLEGGTTVRLYLSGEAPASVLEKLRELLWVSEFHVEVQLPGGRGPEVWEPGVLRYPYPGAAPLLVGQDFWWVAGKGVLLADGLATDRETFGYVVNLHDEHRPKFSVDRREMRAWDEDWVGGELRAARAALEDWPGLSLSWLWEVTKADPTVAQSVYDHLVTARPDIPRGGTWQAMTVVDLGRIGCLEADRAVIGSGRTRYLSDSQRFLLPWRAAVWGDHVLPIMRQQLEEAGAVPRRTDGYPTVPPRDSKLLENVISSSDAQAVLALARPLRCVPGEVLRRLRRYVIAGIDLTPVRAGHDVVTAELPDPLRVAVLQARSFRSWPDTPPTGFRLAEASAALRQPLSEVAAACRTYLANEDGLEDLVDGPLGRHTFTRDDLEILSLRRTAQPPWLPRTVALRHLCTVANSFRLSLVQARERLSRYAPLGYQIYGDDLPGNASPGAIGLAAEALSLAGSTTLDPLHVETLARQRGIPTERVREQLIELTDLGLLTLTEADRPIAPNDLAALAQHPAVSFNQQKRGWALVHGVLQPGHAGDSQVEPALRAAFRLSPPPQPSVADLLRIWSIGFRFMTLTDLIDMLERAGDLHLGGAGELVRRYQGSVPRSFPFSLLTTEHTEGTRWRAALTAAHVLRADRNQTSVGGKLEWLRSFEPLGGPRIRLRDDEMATVQAIGVEPADNVLLDGAPTGEELGNGLVATLITPMHLVRVAGRLGLYPREAHEALARYVPLGVRFEYGPADLPDGLVLWQDLILLTEHHDGYAPAVSGTVPAEHIRAAADLTEESEDWIRQRLCHYAPLFGLSTTEETTA